MLVEQISASHEPEPYAEQVQPEGELPPLQLLPQLLGLPWQTPEAGTYVGAATPQSVQLVSATPVSVEPVSMPNRKVVPAMVTGAL
jgi:hypothetical protein